MRTRHLASAATLSAVAIALTACGPGNGDVGTSQTAADIQLLNEGQLTVCSDHPYPPFEFQQDGEVVGYDMDIADRIAQDLGVTRNVVDSSFEAIESGAALTGCDMAISSISITEERQQVMDFSEPYLEDHLVLVAAEGSGITDPMSAQGQRVGVQEGTTGERYAQDHGLTPVQFEDAGLQVEALREGSVDALLGNESALRYAIRDSSELQVVAEFDTSESLGVAVAEGNTAMLEAVNDSLQGMREDGSLEESATRWFGETATADQ